MKIYKIPDSRVKIRDHVRCVSQLLTVLLDWSRSR